MVQFEKEICNYLNIPSIPLKEWNEKDGFKNGVAIVELRSGNYAYVVCAYDKETDETPHIVKTFTLEQFVGIKKILVVPSYMDTDVDNMDLDDESKRAAQRLVAEASDMEGKNEVKIDVPKNEYFFANIENDEQARAYIQAYNQRNRIKGKIPKNHDTIVARLGVIWYDEQKRNKKK